MVTATAVQTSKQLPVQMESPSKESKVLRSFYSDVTEVIVHPGKVAPLLFQEGVVAEAVLDEVLVATKPSSEKNHAIMRAVSAAVKADCLKIWVFIAVLEKSPESAPVASRMRDALCSHGLGESHTLEVIPLN